ncbi:hypothetical protein CRUP_008865 [Coryphaenoides rupestris]|nr:hypothetical protein CRUP_008865 [Coryphaenoides rupestris]
MNSFQDHTKLILCPLMGAVTYIDEKCEFHTYKMSLLEEFGCTKELAYSFLKEAPNGRALLWSMPSCCSCFLLLCRLSLQEPDGNVKKSNGDTQGRRQVYEGWKWGQRMAVSMPMGT